MKKSIYYDVDITPKGTLEDYKEGNNIPWKKEMTFDSREEADELARHYISKGILGVRIVKVIDPENTPEIKDVFIWFKYSKR